MNTQALKAGGFQRAQRQRVFLKLAIQGPSGAGKTYSALRMAFGISDKIACIDTENDSASLYADIGKDGIGAYDVLTVQPPFHPKKYIEGIRQAVDAGYEVLIIDSFSHAWKELLDMKTSIDQAGGNSFTNWAKIKPIADELKTAIVQSRIHVIACMRAKDEYVLQQDDKGKSAPKKVGMGPIQEPGVEYEFTTVFDVAMNHDASASKDRTGLFGDEIERITEEHGRRLIAWLSSASTPTPAPTQAAQPAAAPKSATPASNGHTSTAKEAWNTFAEFAVRLGIPDEKVRDPQWLLRARVQLLPENKKSLKQFTPSDVAILTQCLVHYSADLESPPLPDQDIFDIDGATLQELTERSKTLITA